LLYWIGGAGYIDIEFKNVNHTGGLINFASTSGGGEPTYGKVKIHGTIISNTANAVAAIFNAGSKVEFDYDMSITDNFSVPGPIIITNTQPTVYYTGKIKYLTTQLAATNAPFINQNSGGLATLTPTFKNLTVETNTDFILTGSGPIVTNIGIMGVYSNKPVNTLLFTEIISTSIVNPLVTV
jgi:hypothetical protein